MRLEKTLDIPNIFSFAADGMVLYCLQRSRRGLFFVVIDPERLEIIARQHLAIDCVPGLHPCVDDDCVYIPTTDGQLVGLDKFSARKLIVLELGYNLIVATPLESVNYTYSLCGVPILTGLKTETDLYSLIANRKSDGRRVFQSKTLKGRFLPPSGVQDEVYCFIGSELCKFNNLTEEISREVKFKPDYKPLISDNYVMMASKLGLLEILTRTELQTRKKLFVGENRSCPLVINDEVFWFAKNMLYRVDCSTGKISKHQTIQGMGTSSGVVWRDRLVTIIGDKMVSVLISDGQVETVDLGASSISEPLIFDSCIIAFSKTRIFKVVN